MERPCYRCGANVDDTIAFCPQCNAPQIRVGASAGQAAVAGAASAHAGLRDTAEDLREPATEPLPPGTPGDVQPPATPMRMTSGYGTPVSTVPGASASSAIDWSQAVPGAVLAGAIVALAWAVPFLSVFIWMALAGVGGVLLYLRRVPDAVPTPAMGARIGALAGLFGFGVFVLCMALQMLVLHSTGQFRNLMQQVLQQAAAQNADPRAQQVFERLASPQGLAIMITLVLALGFVAFLLFATAGGALGAYLARRKER